MRARTLSDGQRAFYWVPFAGDRAKGFSLPNEALGSDFKAACDRAGVLNGLLDAWRDGKDVPIELRLAERRGSVDWWIEEFLRSDAVTRLSKKTQDDYRKALARLADVETKLTDEKTGEPVRTGQLPVSSLSQGAVDKIYAKLRQGGRITRQADYPIDVARRAWHVVSRAHAGTFLIPIVGGDGKVQRLAINPFERVLRFKYRKETAIPVTRDDAARFAAACEERGHLALGAAALICYEWLQRPDDVRGGRITWTDYRPADRPTEVRIFHHKTGESVWMPLEVEIENDAGELVSRPLYPELEAMLARLPRDGVAMITFKPQRGPRGKAGDRSSRLYSEPYAQHIVQRVRKEAGLPAHVTLEGCRHGGMTELGNAKLPEQLIMSLSGHLTPAAARLYVKRTDDQRVAAAVQRRDHVEKKTKRNRP